MMLLCYGRCDVAQHRYQVLLLVQVVASDRSTSGVAAAERPTIKGLKKGSTPRKLLLRATTHLQPNEDALLIHR